MSGATDSGMVKIMGIVMGCLTVFALVCVFAARLLGIGDDDSSDTMMRNALIQRIQPVAAVRTSADDLVVAGSETAMDDTAVKSGDELVNGACAACHVAGVAGAPKLDDEKAWAERRELGLDALVASVINGKGSMPARGGSDYSDEEIQLAVQTIALFEVDDSEAAPASEETPVVADETAAPEEDAAALDEADADEDATTPAEGEQNSAADNAEQAVAVVADESEGEAAVTALVVGQVPDGMTDNIKANVDGVCASCHLAGVANAPKTGDKAAWQERADKGLAALTSSVINGLNVMPARGGSALTDEEIPIAIQYLMSK